MPGFGFAPNDKPTYQGFLGTAQSPSGTPYSSGYLFNSPQSPNANQFQAPGGDRRIDLASLMPSLMQMLGGGGQQTPTASTAIQPPTAVPSDKTKSSQVQGVK